MKTGSLSGAPFQKVGMNSLNIYCVTDHARVTMNMRKEGREKT